MWFFVETHYTVRVPGVTMGWVVATTPTTAPSAVGTVIITTPSSTTPTATSTGQTPIDILGRTCAFLCFQNVAKERMTQRLTSRDAERE